jgi:hypothetical protein
VEVSLVVQELEQVLQVHFLQVGPYSLRQVLKVGFSLMPQEVHFSATKSLSLGVRTFNSVRIMKVMRKKKELKMKMG